ncbi:VTT domain-containing protein [Ruminococcaceae bacterium OttesenSCG-928-A16]|nr:VTT domain-containing protein [Ruminococcaceae bacterium OttesenSCG-928-A16]
MQKQGNINKQKKFTQLPPRQKAAVVAVIAALAVLAGLVFWFVGRPMLTLASQPDVFRNWVQTHGIWGRLAFVGMMTLQIVIAFIPGEPLEIGAGYAFGAIEGSLLCMLGALIGSIIIFAFVRSFGVKLVELFFSKDKIQNLSFLQNNQKLNALVFLIFFIPGTPKDLLSYFVGLTQMRFLTWLAISTFARIPSIVTSTIGGDALGMQNYQFAIIVFVVTLAISGIGLLVYRHICRVKNK